MAEVLLGAVILTFALMAVLGLFFNCIIWNESSRNLTIALSDTQFVMEEIKNEIILSNLRTKINDGVTWCWNEDSDFPNILQRLPNENIVTCCYDSASAVWCCPGGCSCPDEDSLHIRVTSSWDNRGGRRRDISLETLITEP